MSLQADAGPSAPMREATKQLVAEQIACVCIHLAEDINAVTHNRQALEAAKLGRRLVMSKTTVEERKRLLDAHKTHSDPVLKKAVFVLMSPELEVLMTSNSEE